MTIRKLILVASLALGGFVYGADAPQMQSIGPFGGLNTNISPEAIDATQSPDLLNVDISPGGKSVKKRQGYGLDATLVTSTQPVHNLYKFFDSNGNEVRMAFNDNRISSSINGATWSVILATGTVGATWDCTDYLGYAYCVSSAFDSPIKTNGTTAGTTGAGGTNAVPAGSLISNSGDRLLVGATGANPSRLYYSASAVFSDFSLGVQPSNSSFEDIVAPGSKLTHIAYRFGRWLWWKDQSFGFIVGTGQFDLQIITVSNTIGTFDNTDVFDGNYVYFRGSDGKIYTYDGSNLSRSISTDIGPTLQSANRRKANLWQQTLLYYLEAFTSLSQYTVDSAGWVLGSGYFQSTASLNEMHLTNPVGDTPSSFLIHTSFYFTNLNNSLYGFALINSSGEGYGIRAAGGSINQLIAGRKSTIGFVADINVSNVIADTSTHTMDLIYSATGYMQAYFDGVLKGTFQDTSYTGMNRLSMQGSGTAIRVSSLSVTSSTNTFYSNVNYVSNLTSWISFFANDSTSGGGSITYYTRASTNSFTVGSTTPTWISQTNGSIVSASTGTYFQARADFISTSTLTDFTFRWYEGLASDKMYGTYFNNGIWFSISLGTSTTTNNRILRYDLLSNLWTLYDIPSNGFLTYNNNLYFGDPTAGKVYQFGNGVYADNGSAINAYWTSKPFFGDSPFTDKDLRMASWYIKSSPGTTLDINYTLNESTTITKSLSLSDSRRNVIQNNWNFPLGSVATNFSAQVGDNSNNLPWEVFGGVIQFIPRPWKVSLQ